MRRFLIRSVLSVLALAILAVAWIVAGPWWARALDAIHTTRLATATSLSIKKYSGFFRFFPGGVLVLVDGDHRFVLGRCPCAIDDHGYTPAIEADPNGNWYNPNTGESLHPDPNHPPPIGPHMDYRAPNGQWYRWYPNGNIVPKA